MSDDNCTVEVIIGVRATLILTTDESKENERPPKLMWSHPRHHEEDETKRPLQEVEDDGKTVETFSGVLRLTKVIPSYIRSAPQHDVKTAYHDGIFSHYRGMPRSSHWIQSRT